MVFLCYFDHMKWSGKEKHIMLPNGQTQRCTYSPQTLKRQSTLSPHSPYHSYPPLSSGGTPLACARLFRERDVMLKVINIGNVPVMGTSVPSNRKGSECISCF
ncbi:hypothetical protein CHARACLAT_018955 [Characodon lateralis]|uniref:Uncharacterized protein n=1 Tax=Characodon lateralis TaxID=208331 RepID=A0ABU7ENK8_9TELE|nr:hypothetical protein [Characodon lateralis]